MHALTASTQVSNDAIFRSEGMGLLRLVPLVVGGIVDQRQRRAMRFLEVADDCLIGHDIGDVAAHEFDRLALAVEFGGQLFALIAGDIDVMAGPAGIGCPF